MRVPPSIDAGHLRRTYKTVIGETRIGRRDLNEEHEAHRAHLGGLLRGQLQLLLRDLEPRVPKMRQDLRATALHVVTRASGALSLSLTEARDPAHLYDMAVLVRSLLTLYQFPAAHSPPVTSSARS
ncbi:hypothetical protein ACWELO_25895 [Streptomyces sp. NPDC004596]|uniref:hypothetical protein n=1 Tax=Streptomyces sp. NPDC056580 TaxID=3345872 RepID=UPI003692B137